MTHPPEIVPFPVGGVVGGSEASNFEAALANSNTCSKVTVSPTGGVQGDQFQPSVEAKIPQGGAGVGSQFAFSHTASASFGAEVVAYAVLGATGVFGAKHCCPVC